MHRLWGLMILAGDERRRWCRRRALAIRRRSSASSVICVSLLCALGTTGNPARAQETPADVTAAQVTMYQTGLEIACKHAGRKRGEAPEQVDAFCSCSTRVLKENASFSEWQHAYYYWRKRLNREASDLLGPYLPKVQACKDAL